MKTRTIVALLSCIALVLCLYVIPSASAASAEEEVTKVIENAFNAFNTSDGDLLSSLWWHSQKASSFAPDTSPFLTQGWETLDKEAKEMAKLPAGTFKFYIYNPKVTMLGDNMAVITLYLTLVYTDPATKSQDISQARQTMVIQKIDGQWLIVHQHASEFFVK